jgi:hypothetical protein
VASSKNPVTRGCMVLSFCRLRVFGMLEPVAH